MSSSGGFIIGKKIKKRSKVGKGVKTVASCGLRGEVHDERMYPGGESQSSKQL